MVGEHRTLLKAGFSCITRMLQLYQVSICIITIKTALITLVCTFRAFLGYRSSYRISWGIQLPQYFRFHLKRKSMFLPLQGTMVCLKVYLVLTNVCSSLRNQKMIESSVVRRQGSSTMYSSRSMTNTKREKCMKQGKSCRLMYNSDILANWLDLHDSFCMPSPDYFCWAMEEETPPVSIPVLTFIMWCYCYLLTSVFPSVQNRVS